MVVDSGGHYLELEHWSVESVRYLGELYERWRETAEAVKSEGKIENVVLVRGVGQDGEEEPSPVSTRRSGTA